MAKIIITVEDTDKAVEVKATYKPPLDDRNKISSQRVVAVMLGSLHEDYHVDVHDVVKNKVGDVECASASVRDDGC